jgi:hypothetical protein
MGAGQKAMRVERKASCFDWLSMTQAMEDTSMTYYPYGRVATVPYI